MFLRRTLVLTYSSLSLKFNIGKVQNRIDEIFLIDGVAFLFVFFRWILFFYLFRLFMFTFLSVFLFFGWGV